MAGFTRDNLIGCSGYIPMEGAEQESKSDTHLPSVKVSFEPKVCLRLDESH